MPQTCLFAPNLGAEQHVRIPSVIIVGPELVGMLEFGSVPTDSPDLSGCAMCFSLDEEYSTPPLHLLTTAKSRYHRGFKFCSLPGLGESNYGVTDNPHPNAGIPPSTSGQPILW